MNLSEEQVIESLAAEMKLLQSQGPIALEIDAASAFALIGLIQLAMRHPGLMPHNLAVGRSFVERLSVIFPPESVAHCVIQQEYNPQFDQPPPPKIKKLMDFGKKLVADLNESDPEHSYEIVSIEELL